MSNLFFDTSALNKHYHLETGSTLVTSLLDDKSNRCFVTRLAHVEMRSVFGLQVRMGLCSPTTLQMRDQQFLSDASWQVVVTLRFTVHHLEVAEQLLRTHAPFRHLRALDAIQLASALVFEKRSGLAGFVCSDSRLNVVAAMEGLHVINPENP